MANTKKPIGRAFTSETARAAGKKGGLAPKPGQDIVQAREQYAKDFEKIIYDNFEATVSDLELILADKNIKAKDAVVISLMLRAIKDADHSRLEFLLNRTIGKVKDKVEVQGQLTVHEYVMALIKQHKEDE